ncbi:MAG: hypothetical protein PWQ97_441 [Tepidanaerobacteraceae bacterium]|nr:hypothetical protein [Tepidanaerobacteraceae bacterium]
MKTMVNSVTNFEKVSSAGRGMTEFGNRIAISGAFVQEAADKTISAVGSIIKPLTDVQDAAAPLATVMTSTMSDINKSMEASIKAAKDWQATHVQSADEFLRSQYMMASAGLNDIQSIAGTQAALAMATATMGDSTEAANLLATVYNNMGNKSANATDEMTRLADILTRTQQLFQIPNLGTLNESLTYATPAAIQAGMNLEQLSVVVGQLNNVGLQGSMAGTAFAATMRQLTKASQDLGFTIAKTSDGGVDLIGTINNITAKYGNLQDASDKVKMAFQTAFGDEGLRGITLLQSKTKDMEKALNDIKNATGATAKAQATIEANANAQYKILINNLNNLKMQAAQELMPLIMDSIPKIRKVIDKVSEFVKTHPDLVRTVMLIAGIGGAALAVLAPIMAVAGGFIMMAGYGISGIGKVMELFTRLYGFLAGGSITKAIGTISSNIGTVAKNLVNLTLEVVKFGKQAAIQAATGLKNMAIGLYNMARQAITTTVTAMPGLIASVWSFTAALLSNPITWVIASIIGLITVIVLLVRNWNAVKSAAINALNIIKGAFAFIVGVLSTVGTFVGNAVNSVLSYLASMGSNILNAFYNTFKGAVDSVSNLLGTIKGYVSSAVQGALNYIIGYRERLFDSGRALWGAFVEGIKSLLNRPVEVVKEGLARVRKLLPFSDAKEGPLSTLSRSGRAFMNTFATGIEKSAPALKATVKKGFQEIAYNDAANYSVPPFEIKAPGVSINNIVSSDGKNGIKIYGDIHIHVEKMNDENDFYKTLRSLAMEAGT